MLTSETKIEKLDTLRKTAIKLRKEHKTVREIGEILNRSHTWAWLAIGGSKNSKKKIRIRSDEDKFLSFNYESLKKYSGNIILFSDWQEYMKGWPKCCLCCGNKKPVDGLTIDHIIHYSNGGKHELKNLQSLCVKCNARKGKKSWNFLDNIKKFSGC